MFWGATIRQNQPYVFPQERVGKIIHISNVSLGENVDSQKVSIYIENGNKKFKICTLIKDKRDCSELDNYLKVTADSKIFIKDCPKGEVHVTGYLEKEVDDLIQEENVTPLQEKKENQVENKKTDVEAELEEDEEDEDYLIDDDEEGEELDDHLTTTKTKTIIKITPIILLSRRTITTIKISTKEDLTEIKTSTINNTLIKTIINKISINIKAITFITKKIMVERSFDNYLSMD